MTETDSGYELRYHDPVPIDPPGVDGYEIITVDEKKGTTRFNAREVISYLYDYGIRFEGGVPRRFDGRVYAVLPREILVRTVYSAIDDAALNSGVRFLPTDTEVKNILKGAQALLQVSRDCSKAKERDPRYGNRLVAVENGILDLDTESLLPYTPDVFLTSYIHAVWDPDTPDDAPVKAVLEGIIPVPDTLEFLMKMIGYISLEDSMYPPALFNLYGPGNTGKSAIANMIRVFLGEESVSELGLTQITSRFGIAGLKGKRLNICGETGGASSRVTGVDGEMLKRLSDGARVTVEEKNVQPFDMVNRAKFLFCTNKVPDFGDDSSGLYRRLYIIPCRVRQDPAAMIFDRMTDNWSRSWLLKEVVRAYREFNDASRVFTVPSEMRTELEQFKAQDTVSDYLFDVFGNLGVRGIAEAIDDHPKYRYISELYTGYTTYTRGMGAQPLSKRKFAERIRNEYDLESKTVAWRDPSTGEWTTRVCFMIKEGQE